MFLFKTLYSHSASLHPAGVYMGTGKGGEGRLRGVEHLTNVLEVTRHFVRKSSSSDFVVVLIDALQQVMNVVL